MGAARQLFSGAGELDPRSEIREAGELLAEGMARLGLGPTQVAESTGLRRQHVQQIMRGDRPLYVDHLRRLPEPLRYWMIGRMLGRWGKTIADKIPPDAVGLKRALLELATLAGEAAEVLSGLMGRRVATAELGPRIRTIGERAQRIGASLTRWADSVERERVLPLEDEAPGA